MIHVIKCDFLILISLFKAFSNQISEKKDKEKRQDKKWKMACGKMCKERNRETIWSGMYKKFRELGNNEEKKSRWKDM